MARASFGQIFTIIDLASWLRWLRQEGSEGGFQLNDQTDSQLFLGHPKGLVTLFFTEMWERMSYYGMRALLVLFMTGGLTGFNPGLGWSQIEAQAVYGIYVGLVYFMVVPGGWLADNLLGHQKAVLYGAVVIALGHLVLAVPINETFFLGLALVVLGTGLLKGNISTIVGRLYENQGMEDKRDAGYTIFYMSINIGSTIGFVVCGYLGEKVGWHWGFGAAAVGMLLGVVSYIRYRHLLGDAGLLPNSHDEGVKERLILRSVFLFIFMLAGAGLLISGVVTISPRDFAENFAYFLTAVAAIYFVYLYFFAGLEPDEQRRILLLLLLFVAAAAFWSGFDQSGGSLNIFARDYTDLNFFGFEIPVSWVQVFNPIMVIIFAPMFAGFWAYLAKRSLDPSYPIKFVGGVFLMALSFGVMLVAVSLALQTGTVGVQWLLITYLLQTWGELTLSPIGLSAFSKYSPKKYTGQMFGLWFLASAIGGVLAGILGGDAMDSGLESMSPTFTYMIQYYAVIAIAILGLAWAINKMQSRNST